MSNAILKIHPFCSSDKRKTKVVLWQSHHPARRVSSEIQASARVSLPSEGATTKPKCAQISKYKNCKNIETQKYNRWPCPPRPLKETTGGLNLSLLSLMTKSQLFFILPFVRSSYCIKVPGNYAQTCQNRLKDFSQSFCDLVTCKLLSVGSHLKPWTGLVGTERNILNQHFILWTGKTVADHLQVWKMLWKQGDFFQQSSKRSAPPEISNEYKNKISNFFYFSHGNPVSQRDCDCVASGSDLCKHTTSSEIPTKGADHKKNYTNCLSLHWRLSRPPHLIH